MQGAQDREGQTRLGRQSAADNLKKKIICPSTRHGRQGKSDDSLFTDQEREAPRGEVSSPKSQGWRTLGLRTGPTSVESPGTAGAPFMDKGWGTPETGDLALSQARCRSLNKLPHPAFLALKSTEVD